MKEDLILGLREGLTHPALTEHSIPLFMEKLDSDLESAKVKVVDEQTDTEVAVSSICSISQGKYCTQAT